MQGKQRDPHIQYVPIATATAEHPRNDSASIVELNSGELFMVWIEMHASPLAGISGGPVRRIGPLCAQRGLVELGQNLRRGGGGAGATFQRHGQLVICAANPALSL